MKKQIWTPYNLGLTLYTMGYIENDEYVRYIETGICGYMGSTLVEICPVGKEKYIVAPFEGLYAIGDRNLFESYSFVDYVDPKHKLKGLGDLILEEKTVAKIAYAVNSPDVRALMLTKKFKELTKVQRKELRDALLGPILEQDNAVELMAPEDKLR